MRPARTMQNAIISVALAAALGVGGAGPAFGQTGLIDWSNVARALGNALRSWRFSPYPKPTPTTAVAETPTRAGTSTRTAPPARTETSTRVPTRTRTPSHTRQPTRTATETRTATHTRPPTRTATPRPTSTPLPPVTNDGQIAFGVAEGIPPEQKLASAFIVLPYIVTTPPFNTRIELMNMSNEQITLQCFYVRQSDCIEVGFFVSLTENQPLSWSAYDGTSNVLTGTAVPPLDTFDGFAELKCAVDASRPELRAHNVLQGRALVYDAESGETVGYGAVGFQRLSPGSYTGVVDLDGFTYESCPERLHFLALTRQSGVPSSTLITVPCAQDLLTQTPTETVVQMQIVNEFEQVFSSSYRFRCMSKQAFSSFITLSKSAVGTDTVHLIIRGVSTPLISLIVDRFAGQNGTLHTTANEPFLEGGRSATVIFP